MRHAMCELACRTLLGKSLVLSVVSSVSAVSICESAMSVLSFFLHSGLWLTVNVILLYISQSFIFFV